MASVGTTGIGAAGVKSIAPLPPAPASFPESRIPSRKPARLLAVAAVIGIGLGLRLYRLGDESLWFDEAVSVVHLNEPGLFRFLLAERAEDPPMLPVYFVLEYGWARLFGDSLVGLRLFNLMLWVLGAVCLYRLGRTLFGFLAGFTALLMYSLSTTHVYYSQEIRMYALVLPLVLASLLTLLHALERGGRSWYLHVLVNAVLLWTHLFSCFLLAAEGLWLLWAYPDRWKQWLAWGAAHVPVAAGTGVWVFSTGFAALDRAGAWIPMPSDRWFPLALCWADTWIPKALPFLPIGLVTLVVSLGVVFGTAGFRRDPGLANKGLLLVLWLLVPAVSVMAVSYLYTSIAVARYILHASLAFYLLLGAAVALLPSRALRVVALVALTGLLAGQAVRERPLRMQWSQAAAIIAAEAAEGDIVVVSPRFETDTMRWYAPVPAESIFELDVAAPIARRTLAKGHAVWFAGSPNEMDGKVHPGESLDLSNARRNGTWIGTGGFPVHVLRFVPEDDDEASATTEGR